MEQVANSFAYKENQAFWSGAGGKEPNGMLNSADIKVEKLGKNLTSETLNQLIMALPEEYLTQSIFVMNRKTLSLIQNLKDKDGRFIWQQSLSGKLGQAIYGIPVVTTDAIPNTDEAKPSIILADFKKAYRIVERDNFKIMRDPFTEKPFVNFYVSRRIGGAVADSRAAIFGTFG